MTGDLPAEPSRPSGLLRPYFRAGVGDDGGDPSRSDEARVGSLRPFLLTSGRVPSDQSIAIETQVVATDPGRASVRQLTAERRDIIEICVEPLSVAEVAARLALQLGVVRVLVGDLSAAGHLSVYLPNADASTDVDTLLRVIRALRAIR